VTLTGFKYPDQRRGYEADEHFTKLRRIHCDVPVFTQKKQKIQTLHAKQPLSYTIQYTLDSPFKLICITINSSWWSTRHRQTELSLSVKVRPTSSQDFTHTDWKWWRYSLHLPILFQRWSD